MLVLAVGMGFGRFAFTGLFPLMVRDGAIGITGGSYAASANYAGYLAGALALGLLSVRSKTLCLIGLSATVVGLAALAVPLPEGAIIVVRGLAGVVSAFAMIAAANWLIQDQGQHHRAAALFSGVGWGIMLSAEAIAFGHRSGLRSEAIWGGLAVGSLILSVIAYVLMRRAEAESSGATAAGAMVEDRVPISASRMTAIYGLAGFGYIVTATYLPLLVQHSVRSIDPVHVWALFGLAAIPSCFLWHAVHARKGTRASLFANLTIQAVGVALPALVHAPFAYLTSAVLVGMTFTGTVTIVMPAARRLVAPDGPNIIAILTAAYGVGQIVGPFVAAWLFARTGAFDLSLAAASVTLLAAAILCLERVGSRRTGFSEPSAPGP